jgi:hypothetical protein
VEKKRLANSELECRKPTNKMNFFFFSSGEEEESDDDVIGERAMM